MSSPGTQMAHRARTHRNRIAAGVCTMLALGGVCAAGGQAASPRARLRAHSATTLSVSDEGNLRFVKSSGSTLIDEGHESGTIPGNVRVRFTYTGSPNVGAQLTIYGSHGTLQVRASGRLSSPSSASPSFSGNLTITGGSGRYTHASGGGKLYGVFHRRSYAMVVQTRGTVHY